MIAAGTAAKNWPYSQAVMMLKSNNPCKFSLFLPFLPGTLVLHSRRRVQLPANVPRAGTLAESRAGTLKPPNQADGRLGHVGEIVAGQAGELEVGNLVKQAAVFRAERQILADIEIDSAAVNESRLGLVVAGVIAHADERIIQRIR